MRISILACCVVAISVVAAWGVVQVSRSTGGSSSAATREPQIRAPGLVWDDEFSGSAGSRPSSARWEIETGSRDGTLQQYTRSAGNVSLDGHGHLIITARQTSSGGYTSGAIQTAGRFQTEYGRIEARIKLPSGAGLWPAFWAVGSDFNQVGWPRSGEIDVMENYGSDLYKITGSIHGPWNGPDAYAIHSDKFSSASLAGGFHVYGVIWRPDRITFTLDGTPYATVTPESLSGSDQWVFDKPFYLILDLAVGGQYSGNPKLTPFPQSMVVDWVRAYRLAPTGS
jgi:beta-glucanase (GH16 family)